MGPRLVTALMIAAVALVGLAAVASTAWSLVRGEKAAMPAPPPLFPDAKLRDIHASTQAAAARARTSVRAWLTAHPGSGDAAFTDWALRSTPAPPSRSAEKAELRVVEAITRSRTAEQAQAALWLETYGKKAVWKIYLKQAKPFVQPTEEARAKAALKASLALGATLAASEKAHVMRPSPYEVDRNLAALNKTKFSGQTRYSYPSKHDVLGFAALAILDRLDPQRTHEYEWMLDQISYSRLVGGGHFPSDLDAGAYLGTLVGEYELHKAGLS